MIYKTFPFVFDPYHMDLEQHEGEQMKFLGELSVWSNLNF